MQRDPWNAIAIIPARLGSTRFPGKVLAADTGMPMVVHVCQRASEAQSIVRVVVATDCNEVFEAVESSGFEAVLTSVEHTNGTSRLAEAAEILNLNDDQVIVNIQGDEPEIEPDVIDAAEHAWMFSGDGVGTVVTPIHSDEDFQNPNIVKAVLGGNGICAPSIPMFPAVYFSRSPVPYPRNEASLPAYRHVGIYAYSVGAIKQYLSWPPSMLELTESLEQLRWLEHLDHDAAIQAAVCESSHTGIDTPEQYRAFVERFNAKK
jgi:3-deoxy-manno-octulosonate cytidylyltransferase (CMP-KDO synthetase)